MPAGNAPSRKAGPSDQGEDGAQPGLLAAQHVQAGEEKGAERILVQVGQAEHGNRGLGPRTIEMGTSC